jgi:hypothetical protein
LAVEIFEAEKADRAQVSLGQHRQGGVAVAVLTHIEPSRGGRRQPHARDPVQRHGLSDRQVQPRRQFGADHRLVGAGVDNKWERPLTIDPHRRRHAPVDVLRRGDAGGRLVFGDVETAGSRTVGDFKRSDP